MLGHNFHDKQREWKGAIVSKKNLNITQTKAMVTIKTKNNILIISTGTNLKLSHTYGIKSYKGGSI